MPNLDGGAFRSQQLQTQSNPSSSPLASLIAELRGWMLFCQN